VSISLPTGTQFQFRCDGFEPLVVVGVTMPPWPGAEEAYAIEGPWAATV
jgi:mannose-6-phosphate isomerase-like protein (cupin superfamily)